jgi:protease IV
MRRRTAWILAASVLAVSLGAAAVGALALLLKGRGGLGFGGKSYLLLSLDGSIPEQPSADLGSLLERRPVSLRTLVESLERAAADPKVSAVVVRVGTLPDAGWGKVQELRDALARFRKSGKPAYAHLEFCGNKEYYLATACSKIYALPTAILDVSGLSAEVMFFRKGLDKLGVEAQFEGVGKYKNAPNQFTESSFTEPHREQMEAIVDSLFQQYLTGIAAGRGKTLEEVKAVVDGGPYDATGALRAGLVDELLYRDQLEVRLKEAEGITPARYVKGARGFSFDGRPKIALVYAVGEIATGESQNGSFGGSVAGSDTVSGALRQAREDDAVKAVLFRVDSPGGFGPAADAIWREVALASKSKPVVVSMGDYAASGGYYVSMASDVIVAEPGTLTGSIGVFSGKFSLRGLYDKLGISKEVLSRGKNASLYSEYRPWSSEERAKVRAMNVAFYQEFVKKAAEGRKTSYAALDAVAQGRVWTGAEALEHGLVDRLGGLDAALLAAKEKAGIAPGREVEIVVLPERKGLIETFLERQEDDVAAGVLPSDLRLLLRFVRVLGDGAPMARLPFDLRIR